MSIAVMSKVWKDAPQTGTELLVLLALADWADDRGTCWVKIVNLAKKARISERSAQYAVKQFMTDGTLEMIQESVRTQPTVYRISSKYTGFVESTDRGADFARSEAGVQPLREEMSQIAPPYKEKQLSVKQLSVNQLNGICNSCGGAKLLHQKPHIPGPRLIPCPHCQPNLMSKMA
jgi:hypothetical protein